MLQSKSSIYSAIKATFVDKLQHQYPNCVVYPSGKPSRYYISMEEGYTFWAYISLTDPRVDIRSIESTAMSDKADIVRSNLERVLREMVGRYY